MSNVCSKISAIFAILAGESVSSSSSVKVSANVSKAKKVSAPKDYINGDDRIFKLAFNKPFMPKFVNAYKDEKSHGLVIVVNGNMNKDAAVNPKAVCDSEVLLARNGIRLSDKNGNPTGKYLSAKEVLEKVQSGEIELRLKARGEERIDHGNPDKSEDWATDKNGNRYLKTQRTSSNAVVVAVKCF